MRQWTVELSHRSSLSQAGVYSARTIVYLDAFRACPAKGYLTWVPPSHCDDCPARIGDYTLRSVSFLALKLIGMSVCTPEN